MRDLAVTAGLGPVTDFALVAALVALAGMAIMSWWVSQRIEQGVVDNAVANITLHLDSFVEPHLQALNDGDSLPAESAAALSGLLSSGTDGHTVTEITIWDRSGRPVFSTNAGKMATTEEAPLAVRHALAGSVGSRYQRPEGWWGGEEKAQLSIYAPMHHTPTMKLIAAAEVHQSAGRLASALARTRLQTGLLLGLLSLAIAASMFGIVRKSSRTIAKQRSDLAQRVAQLSGLLTENTELQRRILEANRRSTGINDRMLKRVSAELHDGPVQLIALALLRLEGVRSDETTAQDTESDVDAIESALRDALKEIRGLSSGLSLPKLENASVRQAVEYAVMNHESRSRTRVKLDIGEGLSGKASPVFLTCVYRFVQEALNNAVRHAMGKDQAVHAFTKAGDIVIEVRDGGPGIDTSALDPAAREGKGLGLIGLADRIEALGGILEIAGNAGRGACLRAVFASEALANLESDSSASTKAMPVPAGQVK